VWAEVMKTAYRARTAAPWTPPEHLLALTIDPATGLLPAPGCPATDLRVEYFLPGTEPFEVCTSHAPGRSGRR
jgi:membrane carboxypeptidase/penicillin-binding protein